MSKKKGLDINVIFTKMLFLCLVVFFTSCAKKISFGTSTLVPAATGKVKIKKDRNNNNSIDIDISNLAEPGRLSPPRKTYVVWMDTERQGLKNIGQLDASSGLFSSNLKASLHTVTPFTPRKIFITAEDDAAIQYPGTMFVLSTDNFNYNR